jgi:hypothetical protein
VELRNIEVMIQKEPEMRDAACPHVHAYVLLYDSLRRNELEVGT